MQVECQAHGPYKKQRQTLEAGRDGVPGAMIGVQRPRVPRCQGAAVPREVWPPHIRRQRLRAVVQHHQHLSTATKEVVFGLKRPEHVVAPSSTAAAVIRRAAPPAPVIGMCIIQPNVYMQCAHLCTLLKHSSSSTTRTCRRRADALQDSSIFGHDLANAVRRSKKSHFQVKE